MNTKHNYHFCFYIIIVLMLLSRLPAAMAITIDELADICEKMESAIVDISLEYEWYNIPPWTVEELEAEMGEGAPVSVAKDGLMRFKLSAARSLNLKDPNRPLFGRLLWDRAATWEMKNGISWQSVTKYSYDGNVYKYLESGPQKPTIGTFSDNGESFPSLILSPLGFSVFRFGICDVTDKTLVSTVLRRKELVRLDNTIEEINGFNAIHVDFLQEVTKQVFIRIYFSVDHGYTPVRYEYINAGKLVFTIDVQSLQKVAEGLWFPSSGVISSPDDERSDAFQVIGSVLINQGLTAEDFDIEFPVGTEVRDEIQGRKYIVKATEQ